MATGENVLTAAWALGVCILIIGGLLGAYIKAVTGAINERIKATNDRLDRELKTAKDESEYRLLVLRNEFEQRRLENATTIGRLLSKFDDLRSDLESNHHPKGEMEKIMTQIVRAELGPLEKRFDVLLAKLGQED
jgi:hypothetical protein